MTDEQMDARLRAAGEVWRSATHRTADVATAEPKDLTPGPVGRPRPHRTGLLASAAVIAAALVAGGTVLVTNLTGGSNGGAAGTAAPLRGTVWRFLGYGDQLRDKSLATLYISPDGQLVADDSCDLIGGKLSSPVGEPDQLFVSGLELRYYNCTDSVGEVTFDPDVLTSAPRYALGDAGTLTITGAGKTMHLVAAPDLPIPTLDRPTATGATWKLVRVSDGNRAVPLQGDATFRLADGRLQAGDTCNTLSGDAGIDGNQLDVKSLSSTQEACPSDAAASVIDAVLNAKPEVTVQGARLIVRADAGQLVYDWLPADAAATDPSNLTDRTWHLTSVAGDPVGDKVTLRIGSDGTATVFNGCVNNNPKADVGRGTLTMSALSTANFGPGCNYGLATTVDSLLTQQPALWRVDDGTLVINGPGAQAFGLVFKPADGNQSTTSTDPKDLVGLSGTSWKLTGIEAGTGSGGPSDAATAAIAFDSGGHITITHRCYTDKGDVRIEGDTLDISNVKLDSAVPCPGTSDQSAEQQADSTVDDVLSGQSTWAVTGGSELRITKGDTTLVFGGGAGPDSGAKTPPATPSDLTSPTK